MAWKLLERSSTSQEVAQHELTAAHTSYHLILGSNERLSVAPATAADSVSNIVGRITCGPWGVKLEAVNDDLGIQPAHPRINPRLIPSSEEYKLKRRSTKEGRSATEIIFLREDDRIYFASTSSSLALSYDPSEVQVNSSVTGDQEVAKSEELGEVAGSTTVEGNKAAIASEAEEETEDEGEKDRDLDDLEGDATLVQITQATSQYSHSTPHLSAALSEVIQETPTTNRTAFAVQTSLKVPEEAFDAVENTPPESPSGLDTYSTAPTKPKEVTSDDDNDQPMSDRENGLNTKAANGPAVNGKETSHTGTEASFNAQNASSPDNLSPFYSKTLSERGSSVAGEPQPRSRRTLQSVSINKPKTGPKRSSPDAESAASTPVRPSKRAKKETEGTQDSLESNIHVSTKKPTSKRKNRVSTDEDESTIQVTGSQKSGVEDDAYKGPKPRVAFSNSSIDESGNFFKFFKRHGGVKLENVKSGDCNLLCVRNGTLNRTVKVLQCIALGIPIVQDEWLHESSKKGRFLDIKPYMPRIPKIEEELNFSLATVWSKPQPDLLTGKVVYFTPALQKIYSSWKDMEELCKAIGARRVISKPSKELKNSDEMVIMAKDEHDEDLAILSQNGDTCYSKDLITVGILRGDIDLESDEFKISPPEVTEVSKPKKKGRPRKS